jgi:heterodisulfide reductase subunit B
MKKMYLYLGCTIPMKQFAYELSLRSSLPNLGVELEDMPEANCCGTPLRCVSIFYPIYASARICAIAEAAGLDILAPCNGCHLSLSENLILLRTRPDLAERVNSLLRDENLRYMGKARVYHPVEVLHDIIGVDGIASSVKFRLPLLKFAAHPGCHLMRPSKIPRPESRGAPLKLDRLIEALGLKCLNHPEKYECCGAAVMPYSPEAAIRITSMRLRKIVDAGSDGVTTLCPYCFEMFDAKQDVAKAITGDESLSVPIFYYTQLLGLSLGLAEKELGLGLNTSPIDSILERLKR